MYVGGMGSTSPSRLNSRTNGPGECSSARTEGKSRRIAAESIRQRGKRAATNLHFLKDWERCMNRNQSLMAHLHPVFSRPAWNSASVRGVVWPQYSSAPASAPFQLPHARDPASFARGRFSPASFEPPRNHVLSAKPAIPSPHHPSSPGGGQFPRARGAPRRCLDHRQERHEILSPPRQYVPKRALVGHADGGGRTRRSKKRWKLRSQDTRPVPPPLY